MRWISPALILCLVIAAPVAPVFASDPGIVSTSEADNRAGQDPELDALFLQLKAEPRTAGANRISRQIWNHWTRSGSDTIDLLMDWTAAAMRKKEYGLADDLLSQITTLRPDYAEGWNRRATLHFVRSEYGKSLSDIERVLQLEPRHFGALAGLANILEKTNQHRKALETWYEVLAIYPANRNAQSAVIRLEEELAGEGI